jgi:hypothetical protein
VSVHVAVLGTEAPGSLLFAYFNLSVQLESELAEDGSIGECLLSCLERAEAKYPSCMPVFPRGLLCSGMRGGLGLPSGLSCSLGGVLKGDTLSSPLALAKAGAREPETFRVS